MLGRFGFFESFKFFSSKVPIYLDFLKFGIFVDLYATYFFFPSRELLNSYLSNFLLVYNGINYGFFSKVTLKGIGFRCWSVGSNILFDIGFSHFIFYRIPSGINVMTRKNNLLLFSSNIGLLNTVTSRIVSFRKPDAYKGKGLVWFGRSSKLKVRRRKVR